MSERSAGEVKSLIDAMERNVRILDEPEQEWHQVEDGSYNYAKHIPPELYNDEPVIQQMRMLTLDAIAMQAAISWPLKIKVDFPKAGPQAQSDADTAEVFFGHCIERMDPRHEKKQYLHWGQIHSRFGALWPSVVAKNPPKQKKGESDKVYQLRRDSWESGYWRWAMDVLNPKTVSFLDRDGEITACGLYEEIPVLDFLQLYHKGKDGESVEDLHPLRILDTEFPYLRATDGSSPSRGGTDLTNWIGGKKVKRWLIDDGQHICHYVEGPGYSDAMPVYRDVVEPVKNTFGRPSLILFTGLYRPHREMRYRYEAFYGYLAKAERDLNITTSLIWTLVANRKWAQPLPAEMRQQVAANPKLVDSFPVKHRDKDGRPMVPVTMGNLQDVSNLVPSEIWQLYERQTLNYDKLRSWLDLLSPSPETMEKATAAVVLYGTQAGLRPVEGPQASATTGYETLFRMIAHDFIHGLNPHYDTNGPSKEHDQSIEFAATGGEWSNAKAEKGKKYEIGAQLMARFPDEGSVSCEPVAKTDAQKTALVQHEMTLLAHDPPLTTPDRVLEAKGVTDLSEEKAQIDAYILFQAAAPRLHNMFMGNVLKRIAAREGRDEMALAAMAGGPIGVAPPMNGNRPPGGKGFSYQTPAGGTPTGGGAIS